MKLRTIKAVAAMLAVAGSSAFADVTENFDGVSAQMIDPNSPFTVINGNTYKGDIANITGSTTYQTQVINPGSAGYISLQCEETTQGNLAFDANGNPTSDTSNVIMQFPSAIDVSNVKVTMGKVGSSTAWWRYAVQASTNGTTWSNVVLRNSDYRNKSITINQSVDLSAVTAVRFLVWRNGGSDPGEMSIDDIEITETVSTLTITSAKPDTSAPDTKIALDVDKLGDITVNKVEQSPAGANTWSDSTVTDLTADPIVVTNLTAATAYDFRVTYNTSVVTDVVSATTDVAINVVPVTGNANDTKTLELNSTSSASYLDTVISGIQGSTSRTVSAWIKTVDMGSDTRTIVSWGKGSAGNQMVLVVEAGKLRLEAASGARVVNTPDLDDNQWHHVAFAFDSNIGTNLNTVKFYIDGAIATDTTANTRVLNTLNDNKVRIGTDINKNRSFTGSMDEVAIFSRALSRNEIANIHNTGSGRGYFHQIKNDANDTNLVNDSSLIFYYDASLKDASGSPVVKTNDLSQDLGYTDGSNGVTDTDDINGDGLVSALFVGDTVTPAIGMHVSQEGNVLIWSVAEERDLKEYKITYSIEGIIETEVVTAKGSTHYSLALPENAENVVLTVVDNSGYTKPYAPEDGTLAQEIYNLKKGWNLIAITSDNADIEGLKNETVGVVWSWNGASYEAVESAKATDALWVYAPEAKTVYVYGDKSNVTINLNTGWNMVGPLVDSDRPDGADTIYSWDSVYDVILEQHNALARGKGYWIFSL